MNNYTDEQRSNLGFLSYNELIETIGGRNTVLDAHSTLISRGVDIGKDNIIYPGAVIERLGEGKITISDGNTFYPGTYILCSSGEVYIGSGNSFGPAGVTVRANMPTALIEIGDRGRYCDGANIMGVTSLGSGSQVLGNITVQNCALSAGGTFQESDPDKRAAVLKGFGLARNMTLSAGEVVNGIGDFSKSPIERQSFYHPKKVIR